ncbi:MAG: cobalt transporter [Hoeflea sp.]|nr:cobalt transporter [Hoeflea sp.]
MAARTRTLSLTDRLGARTVAAMMAIVIGAILLFGIGLATARTLLDAAPDTWQSSGLFSH